MVSTRELISNWRENSFEYFDDFLFEKNFYSHRHMRIDLNKYLLCVIISHSVKAITIRKKRKEIAWSSIIMIEISI